MRPLRKLFPEEEHGGKDGQSQQQEEQHASPGENQHCGAKGSPASLPTLSSASGVQSHQESREGGENRMQPRRQKIVFYVLIIVATLAVIAVPIWLRIGPVLLSP